MAKSRSASGVWLWTVTLALGVVVGTAGPVWAQYGAGGRIEGKLGVVERCDNFFAGSLFAFPLGYLPWIGQIFDNHDTPDPAAVLVRRGNFSLPRFRNATGKIVEGTHVGDYPAGQLGDESVVNYQDFPDVHDTHDQNFFLRLDPDPGQADIISTFGIDSSGRKPADPGYAPDTLEVEWETGILTSQLTGDGRFFPRWAWPLPGDRVWVNGYWIFDCGHAVENSATKEQGLRSEIHPPRAIASMRRQMATPPGGGPALEATATDVYVHGRAGVAVDLLECGGRVITGPRNCSTRSGYTPAGSDSDDGDPSHDIALDHVGIPIAERFQFTMCTPPLPAGASADSLLTWQEVKPGDTLGVPATFLVQDASGACASPEHGPKQVLVTLPLDGTGATPDDVYGRTVYAAWRGTPRPLRHVRIALDSMTVHDDLDHDSLTPGSDDCECAWFWSSVDRAPDETIRLSDKAIDLSHMNDVGDGETVQFGGATWDFVVADGQAITLRTFGFDGGVGEGAWDPTQDCFDDHFGHHDFSEHFNIDLFDIADVCYASVAIWGADAPNDDPFDVIQRVVSAGELNTLIGDWPATGSAQITVPSLKRCEVGLTAPSPVGIVSVSLKVVCTSAAQIRDFYENAGFHVTSVSEYHQYDLHYTIAISGTDSDGDGLSDADEPGLGTNPLDPDTDHDGLSDGAELNTHHTDPLDADTDDDGLSDGDEVNTYHTDPLDADTDDDGLNDGTEVAVGTDPRDPDSDDDGIPDGRDPGFLRGVVDRLDDGVFRAGGNKTAMLALLDVIEKAVATGDVRRALKELELLRSRVDGCGSQAGTDDWIVDCPSQVRVRNLLDLLVANLGG